MLPIDILRERLTSEVEKRIDVWALKAVREIETQERETLVRAMQTIGGRDEQPHHFTRGSH